MGAGVLGLVATVLLASSVVVAFLPGRVAGAIAADWHPAGRTTTANRALAATTRAAGTRGASAAGHAGPLGTAPAVGKLPLPRTGGARLAAASDKPTVTLVHQPWTVGPGEAFATTIAVSGNTGDLDVSVTLFSRLHTRSALSQTLSGTLSGTVRFRSDPVALSTLPSAGAGQYRVNLVLQTPDTTTSAGQSTNPGEFGPAELVCSQGRPGTCGGVYPVEIQVGAPASAPTARLVTEMVYAYPAGNPYHATMPLRTAMVVPLTLTTGSGAPPAGAVTQLARTAQVLSSPPALPLTVVPEPAAVDLLQKDSAAGDRQALAALQTAAADQAHQVVLQSYVPVDAEALVESGLGSELTAQVDQACRSLATTRDTSGTWVSTTPLDAATAAALAGTHCDPVRHLVVPPSSVSGGGCSITCAAPFTVAGVDGPPITAVESDAQLSTEIAAPTTDPVLRAHELLADLSLAYFEAPTPAQPRGIVLAVPSGTAVAPDELASVIAGVSADPVLRGVTLAQLFEQVPVGANHQPGARHLTAPSTTHGLPVQALRTARQRLDGYRSAVSSTVPGQQAAARLGTVLLRAESSELRPNAQRQAVNVFEDALDAQLHHITLSGGDVRLTSSSVLRVPITLNSTTGFPVAGTLVVSSDKLLFNPKGPCTGIDRGAAGFTGVACTVVLSKDTNAVYVSMRARIGGDFRMAVTFDAPGQSLAILHGDITVRSLSTSVEAVALSIAAGTVLVLWWARTGWRGRRGRRRARHGRHARTPAAGPAGRHENPRPGPAASS